MSGSKVSDLWGRTGINEAPINPSALVIGEAELFVGHAELRFFRLIQSAAETCFAGADDAIAVDVRAAADVRVFARSHVFARAETVAVVVHAGIADTGAGIAIRIRTAF